MPRSPFPGMDPYLESPDIWPDVHSSLMYIFREQLIPLLAPNYIAELQTQIVIDRVWENPPAAAKGAVPDVTVAQKPKRLRETVVMAAPPAPIELRVPIDMSVEIASIHIRQREKDRIVAVIELLSPVNKRPGTGRQEYLEKRAAFLQTGVHFIEIDLLRKWPRMPFDSEPPASDYLAMARNAYEGTKCLVWPIGVRQSLPTLPVSLLRPDPDVPLDMGAALRTAYEHARYDLRIDYTQPPDPPLSPENAEWAASLLATASQ